MKLDHFVSHSIGGLCGTVIVVLIGLAFQTIGWVTVVNMP
uniref:Uncharacterized protein n=1 Tax=Anguilla anguilla TaxID=7936 RepID=A0A0E9PRA7_ANGAN